MAVKEPKVVSLDNHLRFWAIISMCIWQLKSQKLSAAAETDLRFWAIISMCIWQLKSQKLSAAAVQSTNLDKGSKVEVASGSYIHL